MITAPRRRWLDAWPAHVLVMAIAVALAYGRTLGVPFYLDDYSSILENRLVWAWQGFGALREYAPMRVLAYASFALNYRWGGFDPAGYHLANLVIHLLAGVAVYGLVRGLLRGLAGAAAKHGLPSSQVAAPATAAPSSALPFFVALLFLLHPLQTGAVTYVVQRLASLVALFYIAALACYLQARLATGALPRLAWSVACLGLGLAALFTKENAATLPGAFLLLELVILRPGRRDLPWIAGVVMGSTVLVWWLTAFSFGGNPLSLPSMGAVASQSGEISRGTYLATQMPVLWTYLRLFLWPAGLHLERAADILSFVDAKAWTSLAGHVAVIAVAVALVRRRPLIAFGLLFYYLAHAVESLVIPIPELAFEHRTYLPNLGLCLVAGDLLRAAIRSPLGRQGAGLVAIIVLLLLGTVTCRRNEQWRDPIDFWIENVRLAPSKARAWGQLGKSLVASGKPEEGLRALQESLRLRSAQNAEDDNWGYDVVNVAEALRRLGRAGEALPLIGRALGRPLAPAVRSALHIARGNVELDEGRLAQAEASFREALRNQPASLTGQTNLASTLARLGRLAEADSLFGEVLSADPRDTAALENRLQVSVARLVELGDQRRAAHRDAEADSAYRAALAMLTQLQRMNAANPAAASNAERIRERLRGGRPR